MQSIEEVITELVKCSESVLELHPPVEETTVQQFEREHNLVLPPDYKRLLQTTDGFNLMGTEVYGLSQQGKLSLAHVYEIEHNQVAVAQYKYLVPFCNDGRGNFYCFDTRSPSPINPSCPVVFWVSNYHYSDADQPEKTHTSFAGWLQECVIDWTLDDYDYEGNARDS